jgi:hypothetical protein
MSFEALAFVADPEAGLPGRDRSGSTNLARPWRFPAGHADSILCRRHSRSFVQVPVEITLARPDGSLYDKGTAVIRDLSYSGLRLGDVFLARGAFLAPYFGVELRPALEPPGGDTIPGRILRTPSSEFHGFGIEFLFPESGAEERLRRMSGLRAAGPAARAVGPSSRGAPPAGFLKKEAFLPSTSDLRLSSARASNTATSPPRAQSGPSHGFPPKWPRGGPCSRTRTHAALAGTEFRRRARRARRTGDRRRLRPCPSRRP